MTATDGFILRNTPILGRTAVTHHLFEIHLNVFIPPVSFSVKALSERSQVLLESITQRHKAMGKPEPIQEYSTRSRRPFPPGPAKLPLVGPRAWSSPQWDTH